MKEVASIKSMLEFLDERPHLKMKAAKQLLNEIENYQESEFLKMLSGNNESLTKRQ